MMKDNHETTHLPADFHTHTTASDGALSPQALLDLAIQNGAKTLAITDHDTVAGYQAVCDTPQANRLDLITGVEVSTAWQGVGIHIVGLNFDAKHTAMTQLLAQQSQARQQRAQVILHKLDKAGLPITLAEVQANAQHSHIGRPHIARVMLEKGYVNSMDKAFSQYLGAGKMGDVKSGWVSVPEAVAAIRASGGMAVIAHPNHYKMTRSKQLRLLDEFIAAGGQGIEVISGKQHRDVSEKYAQIAIDNDLYASVGSDFHRHFPHGVSVGKLPPLPYGVTPIWQCFKALN